MDYTNENLKHEKRIATRAQHRDKNQLEESWIIQTHASRSTVNAGYKYVYRMLEHSTHQKQSGEAWIIPHTNNEWDSWTKKYFGEDHHNVHGEGSFCLTDHYLAGKVQLKQLKTCIEVDGQCKLVKDGTLKKRR